LTGCDQGLTVLEIKNKEDEHGKVVVANFETKNEGMNCLKAVDVDENYLYAVNETSEDSADILVFDRRSSYVTPQIALQLGTRGKANDLVVRDELIYVAAGKEGLQIVQLEGGIMDPHVGSVPFSDQDSREADAQGIFLDKDEDIAYIAAGYEGLQIVDVQNTADPQLLASHEVDFFARAVYVQEFEVKENTFRKFAFIVGGEKDQSSGMKIVDVENPNSPQEIRDFYWTNEEPILDIVLAGKKAIVLPEKKGIRIFDISNPTSPQLIENYEEDNTSIEYTRIALHDELIFSGSKEQGVLAISINENGEVVEELARTGGWSVRDVAVLGNYLYIVDGTENFRVVDFSEFKNPKIVAFEETSGNSIGITIAENKGENRIYLSNGDNGIDIFRIGEDGIPVKLAEYKKLKGAVDVEAKDNYAYVATSEGVAILDISNLEDIHQVQTLPYEGGIKDITIEGEYIYVAKGDAEMEVYRIVNPRNPKPIPIPEKVDLYNTLNSVSEFKHVFIAGGDRGIRVIDISDPNNLKIVFDYEKKFENDTKDVSILGQNFPSAEKGKLPRIFAVADGANLAQIYYFAGEGRDPSWTDTYELGSVGDNVILTILTDKTPNEPRDFHIIYGETTGGLEIAEVLRHVELEERGLVESPGRANFWELVFGGSNPQRTRHARQLVWGSAGGFVLTLLLLLALSSGTILPATRRIFSSDVFTLLIAYLMGGHGPVIFAEEGKETRREGPFRDVGPGFTKVDAVSAIVLERTAFQPGCIGGLIRAIMGRHPREHLTMRTEDVGINFTRPGERLRGVADLRRQIRLKPEIKAHTRDGIEVNSVAFALFTLGEKPDVYKVTYVGEEQPENLRVIKVRDEKPKEGEWKYPLQVVDALEDILDPEDKLDAHRFVQSYRRSAGFGNQQPREEPNGWRPFEFFAQRVFAAITARPFDVWREQRIDWPEIPVHLSVNKYREMLSEQLYDQLFLPNEPESYPLKDFKNRLRLEMVNQGILAYQFVERADGKPIEEDQELRESLLIQYPQQDFNARKAIRSRGIKIITAGFTELKPSIPDVQGLYLYDQWRAPWQQEATIVRSDHELQAMRIKNLARSQAQHDMIYALSKILKARDYSKEAMAMRVFQALETAAADPATQRLLPRDTIEFMRSLRILLLR